MNGIGKLLRDQLVYRLDPGTRMTLSQLKNFEMPWQRTAYSAVSRTANNLGAPTGLHSGHGAVVSRGYDAREQLQISLSELKSYLDDAGIEYAEIPGDTSFEPRLVVSEADRRRTTSALLRLVRCRVQWSIRAEDGGGFGLPLPRKPSELITRQIFLFKCLRKVESPQGVELSTKNDEISIEFWTELGEGVERKDGNTHIPGTLHRPVERRRPIIDYLTPANWERALAVPGHVLPLPYPDLYQVTEPIDLVYTWVDGADPEWRKRKDSYQGKIDAANFNETALAESRYFSRDELRYSLRSVQYYASWINHIYIVTDGQVPSWLNTEHPKITVVDHKEIFKDPGVLPVFNSHAIESQLHHIPGLSEHYLYLNDDFLFMGPVSPELFFTSNGLSKYFPSKAPLDIDPPTARDLPVMSAAKRNRALIEEKFGRLVTRKFRHTPQPQLKSVLEEMEAENQEMFDAVSASRFRSPDDYSIPSALYHFYAYCLGKAVTAGINYGYIDLADPDVAGFLRGACNREKLQVLCINDGVDDPELIPVVDKIVAAFFARKYPVPSDFEK